MSIKPKERFEVLDIFRGIFASMVVFFHLSPFANTPILNNNFIGNSDLFVDFFFVLSGFVITYSYEFMSTGQDFLKFYKKRFMRLYPLHFIMLIAFLAIELSKKTLSGFVHVNELEKASNNVTTFFSSLMLVHSVKLPGVHDVSWNLPSWSISAEMIAYLVFGIVVVLLHKLKLVKVKVGIYLALLCGTLVVFSHATGDFKLTYSFDYGFLRAILGFFCGVLCFHGFSNFKVQLRAWPKAVFHVAEPVVIFAIIIMVWHKSAFISLEYIFELLFVVSIFTFSFQRGFISAFLLKFQLLHNIGAYSYSIYMTHALLISLFNILFIRLLHFPTSSYAYLFILNYAIIYLISSWTYKHIEMRFSKPIPKKHTVPVK